MAISTLLLITMTHFSGATHNSAETPAQSPVVANGDSPITVLVKYKTQPGKEDVALEAITELVKNAATEPYFINITICVDPADSANILLYEQWESEAYYKGDHGNTEHLQEFIGRAMAFLAGPPEISFWKVYRW